MEKLKSNGKVRKSLGEVTVFIIIIMSDVFGRRKTKLHAITLRQIEVYKTLKQQWASRLVV